MNAPQARAVEANLTSAESPSTYDNRTRRFRGMSGHANPEATSWMEEEQLDAEMEFMIAEMAGKNRREYRRSLNY